MKTVIIHMEDDEHRRLSDRKGSLSWKKFLIGCVEDKYGDDNKEDLLE